MSPESLLKVKRYNILNVNMKRSFYKFECNMVKKLKVEYMNRVNKRKADNVLYGNDKKRLKHVHERYRCELHGEKYICDMYECDGRVCKVSQNIMSYIN